MTRHHPADVLKDFHRSLTSSQSLAAAAQRWIVRSDGPRNPRFTVAHRDMLIELAFLHLLLGWERFLEESFLLYMLGRKSPRKYSPRRFISPPTWNHAFRLTLPEWGRSYAEWDNAEAVRERAQRFFARGDPYERILSAHTHMLKEIQTIRNAIVHRSVNSHTKFENLVRNNLGYFPRNIRVGTFLNTTVRGNPIPISYLDSYISILDKAAKRIVP